MKTKPAKTRAWIARMATNFGHETAVVVLFGVMCFPLPDWAYALVGIVAACLLATALVRGGK